ncbi:putative exonuclease [Bacillus phage SP-15]|uniref:Putative exonuclease n=1 Tax=Bacillus phage SP-15 TaxID=1792032 RepID=A0A127AXH3_9CAUD|nr:putative exonuclease [Bacillus phage SP-15]AMM44934.1 putative exonuclease [Bacillus phage SP-15]
MLIGYYTDPHWTMASSILKATSGKLGPRLESMIESYRWMYDRLGKDVDAIVDGGDLTDNAFLRAEEISAMSTALSFNKGIPEYHLLGNHEKLTESSEYHSLSMLGLLPHIKIIDKPQRMDINPDVSFLPYSHNPDLSTIRELSGKVLFSHVTVLGSLLTSVFRASHGVDAQFLDDCFDLVLNGHIHSSQWVSKKVLNFGVMTGVSFGDNYQLHYPSIGILDTDTMKVEVIENPHAIRFKKFECDTIAGLSTYLNGLKPGNYALQVKVPFELRDEARRIVNSDPKVVSSRVSSKIDTHTVLKTVEVDKISNRATGRESLVEFVKTKKKLSHEASDIFRVIDSLYE